MAGASDGAVDPALLKEREAMFGSFTQFTTYSVIAVASVLILMAIFLL